MAIRYRGSPGCEPETVETHELEVSALADEREAEALGVGGVPAFVADRMAALSGVQSVGNLKRLVEHVRARAGVS